MPDTAPPGQRRPRNNCQLADGQVFDGGGVPARTAPRRGSRAPLTPSGPAAGIGHNSAPLEQLKLVFTERHEYILANDGYC
jgi:hypothetical protein